MRAACVPLLPTLGVVMAESAWLSGQCTRAESRAPALFDMRIENRIELVVVRRCRGVRCSTCATTCTPSPFVVSLSKCVSRSSQLFRPIRGGSVCACALTDPAALGAASLLVLAVVVCSAVAAFEREPSRPWRLILKFVYWLVTWQNAHTAKTL